MDAYKGYIDYIMAGKVAETAYMLSKQGAICSTNLPIQQLPTYEFELVDENDPDKTHKVIVDERVNLLQALQNKGVAKNKAGIRLYNQKYYTVHYDEDTKSLYLKKGNGGACISKTNNFILIGTYNVGLKMDNGVPQNPGQLNKRIEELAKSLIKQNS